MFKVKQDCDKAIRLMADLVEGHRGKHTDETWKRVKQDFRNIGRALELLERYRKEPSFTIFDDDIANLSLMSTLNLSREDHDRIHTSVVNEFLAKEEQYKGLFGKTKYTDFDKVR
jgi:hypothetical protein